MSDSPITLRGRGGGVVFQGTQSPGGGVTDPLTQDLRTATWAINGGTTEPDVPQLTLDPGNGAGTLFGGAYAAILEGGNDSEPDSLGALVLASAGAGGGTGRVRLRTGGTPGTPGDFGVAGQALVSDDAFGTVWAGVASGAGPPSGAIPEALPLYIDTGNSDLYVWTGAAWIGPYSLAP